MRMHRLTPALLFAALAPALAGATDNPATTTQWRPDSRAALIELVECHADTGRRLTDSVRQLGASPHWSYAHQSLAVEQDRHRIVGAVVKRLMDRVTYGALLEVHFPDGLEHADSATRVDRWTRCTRLYNRIANDDRRARSRRADAGR